MSVALRHGAALLLAAWVVGCTDAPGSPADASATPADVDELPRGCGEVPAGYACDGTSLRHCEDEVATTLRCPAYTNDAGTCALISPRYGHYCVTPVGAPCRIAIPHGSHDHIYYASCAGEAAACVLRVTPDHEYEGTCEANFGACEAGLAGRCRGTNLVVRCERGMAVTYDCASFGGRCDNTLGACVGVAEGRRCGASFVCAEGLTCAPVPSRRGVSACRR